MKKAFGSWVMAIAQIGAIVQGRAVALATTSGSTRFPPTSPPTGSRPCSRGSLVLPRGPTPR